jgi:hypothetical protein
VGLANYCLSLRTAPNPITATMPMIPNIANITSPRTILVLPSSGDGVGVAVRVGVSDGAIGVTGGVVTPGLAVAMAAGAGGNTALPIGGGTLG